jgi:hypothetical protein
VVEPGDSLWSISEERLGPGATPEQVVYEVQRIFELNRERIGENPNLIFPGQQFFLASPAPVGGDGGAAASEQPVAVAEPEAEPVVEQRAPEPIVAESEGVSDSLASSASPAAEGAVFEDVVPEDGVSEGAVSEDVLPAVQTPDSTDEQPESTPAESAPAQNTPAESTPATTTDDRGIAASLLNAYDTLKAERRLLGVGVIALTLIIAALMAWRLPMRRNVEDPAAWGIPQEYYENYAPSEAPTEAPTEATKVPEGEPSSSSPASGAPLEEETTPEPSVSSSSATNGSPNGSTAGEAEDAVVAVGGAAEHAEANATANATANAAASARAHERLRRVRHLRRIRQRRTPSNW